MLHPPIQPQIDDAGRRYGLFMIVYNGCMARNTGLAGVPSRRRGTPKHAIAFAARLAGRESIARLFVALILLDGRRDVFLTCPTLILINRPTAELAA